jgi:hypothetical protein
MNPSKTGEAPFGLGLAPKVPMGMGLGGPGSAGLAVPRGMKRERDESSKPTKPKASRRYGDDDGRRVRSNQPDLPPGTRVEVEFMDDEAGKCWFDGVVDHQNQTGTVVHFDDGDVQDLDLNTIPFGILKMARRSEIY